MPQELKQQCTEYLSSRRSDFAFRSIRFGFVYDELKSLGLSDGDTVYDIGAGRCDFDKYLRMQGWEGRYVPIDAVIDGTDLDYWVPNSGANPDFCVAIEVLEHLHRWKHLVMWMRRISSKGVVVTTPNPLTTDVLGMDYTHVTAIPPDTLEAEGFKTFAASLFLQNPEDTLVGTFTKRNANRV